MGQITSNILKKAFATWQHTRIVFYEFYDIFAWACTEIKISSFWMRKWPTSLGFLPFFFLLFVSFLLQCLTFYWAASSSRNTPKHQWDEQTFPQSSQVYSGRKFCSEFFTQICEHFCAYFGLTVIWESTHDHWKDLFLLQNLSKSDVNFGQRWWHQQWNKDQRSWWPVTAGTGVNGLNIDQPEETQWFLFLSWQQGIFFIYAYFHLFIPKRVQ